MLTLQQVDINNRLQVRQFIDLPFRLYAGNPYWVPPIRGDIATMLDPKKHPYYEHSTADFFLALRDGQVVGRIAALENRPFNEYHKTHKAQFYLFDAEDEPDVADMLFGVCVDWAKKRGLNELIGPKGFGPLDGYGLLQHGFDHRQTMNMSAYNYSYYIKLVEDLGFTKVVDFVTAHIYAADFKIPERVHRIAARASIRADLKVIDFKSKRELLRWAPKIGHTYNAAFVNNWEYAPFTEREIKFVVDNILLVADHRLIKIIAHRDDMVGFLFAFPDVSAALQRIKGKLFPFGIIDLLRELKRTDTMAVNGAGILPEYQGRGGNALLYSEMEKTLHAYPLRHAEMVQVAETAVQMRSDLHNLGGNLDHKNHRVYGLTF